MSLPSSRDVFRAAHNAFRTIKVRYFSNKDAAGFEIILVDAAPAKTAVVARIYNPSEVTAWFNSNSKKNVGGWKTAYWESGLKAGDCRRPAPVPAHNQPVEPDADRVKRQANNAERLKKIYPTLRPRIAAVIADMEAQGWRPQIDVGVYRSPAEQAEKVRKGYSKVSYSYHCVTGAKGTPESLAADIVDTRYGWEPPSAYWLQLAACAESHGMESGIRWGLADPKRVAINLLIRLKNWSAKYSMGWDAAHVQVSGISLGAARRGVRPK